MQAHSSPGSPAMSVACCIDLPICSFVNLLFGTGLPMISRRIGESSDVHALIHDDGSHPPYFCRNSCIASLAMAWICFSVMAEKTPCQALALVLTASSPNGRPSARLRKRSLALT